MALVVDGKENVPLPEGFTQVIVWPGSVVGAERVEEFVEWVKKEFDGCRAVYLEEIATQPNEDEWGHAVPGTGARNDLFFSIHKDDIEKFAVPRFKFGMRWVEDVYLNGGAYLYPARVANYRTW